MCHYLSLFELSELNIIDKKGLTLNHIATSTRPPSTATRPKAEGSSERTITPHASVAQVSYAGFASSSVPAAAAARILRAALHQAGRAGNLQRAYHHGIQLRERTNVGPARTAGNGFVGVWL